MARKFEDPKELPVGTHDDCLLESVKRKEPSEEALVKFPDLKPYVAFTFRKQGGEFDGYTATRFCTDTASKMGHLFAFATDLNGGVEPDGFDEADFEGDWFRIRVRKKATNDKLFVQGADPIDAPEDDAPPAKKKETKSRKPEPVAVADDGDDGVPF
jgi:hypothetical protein